MGVGSPRIRETRTTVRTGSHIARCSCHGCSTRPVRAALVCPRHRAVSSEQTTSTRPAISPTSMTPSPVTSFCSTGTTTATTQELPTMSGSWSSTVGLIFRPSRATRRAHPPAVRAMEASWHEGRATGPWYA